MMEIGFKAILRLSVELELGMSRLYRLFSENFPNDADFWWKLSKEEINHASLIRTGEKYIHDDYPTEMLCEDAEVLSGLLERIENLCTQVEKGLFTRVKTFDVAMEFEGGAGEVHYQFSMSRMTSNELLHLFREINAQDMNHLKRIRKYRDSVLQKN